MLSHAALRRGMLKPTHHELAAKQIRKEFHDLDGGLRL